MADAKVEWFGDQLLLEVAELSDDAAFALALYIEGEAKKGAAVDTGYMRNAIYSMGANGEDSGQAPGKQTNYSSEQKRNVTQDSAPTENPPESGALVHASAEYTMYQEQREPFLYPALERAVDVAPQIMAEFFND